MAFVFNLQPLVEMRDAAAKEAARALDEVNDACERLRVMLEAELQEYFAEREVFNETSRAGDFGALGAFERALDARKKRLFDVMTSLRELESEARLAEQALILAKRELKGIENLREKREAEWRLAEERKEARVLDELTSLGYSRRARAGFGGGETG